MDVRTYRAKSLPEALARVREELGPEAAVLKTRDAPRSWLLRMIPMLRQVEVTASAGVHVPSRLPEEEVSAPPLARSAVRTPSKEAFGEELSDQLTQLRAMVNDLCRAQRATGRVEIPQDLFQLYAELIDAEIGEDLARELVERARAQTPVGDLGDPLLVKARLVSLVEGEIKTAGPIRLTPGQCRVVALVGPTGVGKTTTIAKLAANYRLREKRRVGLITVDTFRIAAVEQLRTYADIIDLPMQVVSTPREMRDAVAGMSDLDLLLIDTAGRSPRDEVKIHELRSFLNEAGAAETHLVLGSGASASTLKRTAEQFQIVSPTSVVLTKLDEATGLGNLLPLLRACPQPLSYLTNGQNVPDDIEVADSGRLARLMLEADRG